MEFEVREIKTAIEMATKMVNQYQQEVLNFNGKLFQIVQAQAAATATSSAQNTYLPAIAGIGSETTAASTAPAAGNGVKFEIGQAVSMRPNMVTAGATPTTIQPTSMASKSMLLLSEVKTSTLISSNEEILSQ